MIGSRPTGWWRDRAGAARHLTARVRQAAAEGKVAAPVVLVLEGRAKAGVDEGLVAGVEVVHAPRAGDDTLVSVVAEAGESVLLVTADRALAERAKRHGAEILRPTWLLDRL